MNDSSSIRAPPSAVAGSRHHQQERSGLPPPRLALRIGSDHEQPHSHQPQSQQQQPQQPQQQQQSSNKTTSTKRVSAAPLNLHGIDLSAFDSDLGSNFATFTPVLSSPSTTSFPPVPPQPIQPSSLSPPVSPRLPRDGSRNLLSSFKSSNSNNNSSTSVNKTGGATSSSSSRSVSEAKTKAGWTREEQADAAFRPGTSGISKIYHLRKNPGSTPELNLMATSEGMAKSDAEELTAANDPSINARASPIEDSASMTKQQRKENNRGFRNPLTRSKSIRSNSGSKSRSGEKSSFEQQQQQQQLPQQQQQQQQQLQQQQQYQQPPKTAPLSQDWPDSNFLRARSKEKRGKSADRSGASESEEQPSTPTTTTTTSTAREKGNTFMMGSKQVMSRARTGGGNILNRLGKMARSGSSHEKEVPDSEYVLKVIILPLVEQTRITRISKTLDACRDKTEYWMPSLPWRCIDYLNLHCENEGLYRVPGSAHEVKHWQRRFDTELDLDLLDEQNLYDPNTVGSMLKSWLRNLPTEIMPKALQHALGKALAEENPEYQRLGEPVPQKLRNALSLLPPFNYYLLFAITCHLSLLLSHKDRNKMDLNNLSICIGPPLDLERWLFNYLVGDWRNCWQGCFTEPRYREVELAHSNGEVVPPVPFPETEDGRFDFDVGPDEFGDLPGGGMGASGASVDESALAGPHAPASASAVPPGTATSTTSAGESALTEQTSNSTATTDDAGNQAALPNPAVAAEEGYAHPSAISGNMEEAGSAAVTANGNHTRMQSSVDLPIMTFHAGGMGGDSAVKQ